MKIAVIDIGSNSVRLMIMADGKTLYKKISTTRLGEGVAVTGKLSQQAIDRSALAVKQFVEQAKAEQAEKIFTFATAAVRSAVNGKDFTDKVFSCCGERVDVVSGSQEAELGITGALRGRDGGIIDVGGASTEISLQRDGKKIYSRSVDIGAVRLKDLCGQDKQKLQPVIDNRLKEYDNPDLSVYDMYAVGGTATSLAALKHKLKVYDPKVVDGTVLTVIELEEMSELLLSLDTQQRKNLQGMDIRRADVIAGGCFLLYKILASFGADKITVSESDNLEGYAILMGY